MKKILFALLLMIAAVSAAYAQKVHYGLKGGLNFSNASSWFDNYHTSFFGGGFATVKLNNKWALQPEVLYYRSGSKGQSFNNLVDRKEDFISIPVVVKYHVTPKLYVEAGPEVSYMVQATEDFNGHINATTQQYNRVGLGVSAGVGFNLPHGFGVNARYTIGVNNMAKDVILYNSNAKIGIDYTFKRK